MHVKAPGSAPALVAATRSFATGVELHIERLNIFGCALFNHTVTAFFGAGAGAGALCRTVAPTCKRAWAKQREVTPMPM